MTQRQAMTKKKKAPAYRSADRAGKSRVLTELVELTGWHRDWAQAVWRAPADKRLAPMLPTLASLLRRDGELDLTDAEADLLVCISAATIDRRLAPERGKLLSRGRSHNKPGTLLRSQIPIRTWADWDNAVPEFVEIDLVGHEGGNASGEFCLTLTDNGSVFINHHLFDYCVANKIAFTKSRASHSNDRAHVEQKNWTHVLELVGYVRYHTPTELDLLNQIWELDRVFTNASCPNRNSWSSNAMARK